jgi:hypothetical protein
MKTNVINLKKIGFPILKEFDSNCWIAGGAISDFFLGKECKNLDIFFPNAVEKKKAVEKLISLGGKMREGESNTMGSPTVFEYEGNAINIIHLGTTPEACITRFDYTVCCAAIDKKGNFYYHEKYFEHLGNKEIHYIGNHPNINFKNKSRRLQKYLNKGYLIRKKNLNLWLTKLIQDQNRARNKKSVIITEFKIIKQKLTKSN